MYAEMFIFHIQNLGPSLPSSWIHINNKKSLIKLLLLKNTSQRSERIHESLLKAITL